MPKISSQPGPKDSLANRLLAALIGIGIPTLVYLGVVFSGHEGEPLLRGDGYYYASIAISLWQDRDLDLGNQLPGSVELHTSHISLDRRGRFVPKHPIFMPLASLPVVILLGEKGPLVFNVLMLVAIVGCLFWLAQRLVSPWAAAVAVALTGIATTLPSFAWGYSGDLFAVLAVLAALVVLPTSPSTRTASRTVFAGVLFAVGAISKLPFLLAAAAASLLLARPRIRSGLLFAAGLSVPLLCFAVLNTHLFGSPFVTSYDRIAIFSRAGTASGWHTLPVGEYFDLPLLAGMAAQLTDAERGLLATTPITVLSFLLVPVLWRLDRPLAVFVTSVSLGLYLFFSTYSLWQTSQHGNRFLLLPVVLGVLPLAAAAQALGDWFRRRRETQRLEAT